MLGERLIKANQIAKKMYHVYHDDEYLSFGESYDTEDNIKGIYRKTKVRCSCWMCQNRRKLEGLTMQEKRQLEVEDEDLCFE